MIWGVRACCFSEDEQSNPSRALEFRGHFLTENVAHLTLVVLMTFALLVDGETLPPAK